MNIQALQEIFQQRFGVTLSPNELQELTQTSDTGGRSPLRARQLTDLRLAPRADDPRPTFFQTSVVPRDWDVNAQHEFPKLMWSPNGVEIRIDDGKDAKAQEADYEAKGYLHIPPASVAPIDAIEKELAQLSDEDRAMVLELTRQSRMAKLQEKIALLSDADLSLITGSVAPVAAPVKAKKSA